MIKIIKNLSLILLTSCSLILPSGCGESKTYNYDDYIIKLNVSKNEPFKIMQLSDLHLGIKKPEIWVFALYFALYISYLRSRNTKFFV